MSLRNTPHTPTVQIAVSCCSEIYFVCLASSMSRSMRGSSRLGVHHPYEHFQHVPGASHYFYVLFRLAFDWSLFNNHHPYGLGQVE